MRNLTARLLLLPLLLAGCQQAVAAPSSPAAAAPQAKTLAAKRPTVGVLIFDGVQPIDYTGPFEVFGQAGYDVFTVAKRKGDITTAMGQTIKPAHAFADAPKLDILVIPGGDIQAVMGVQKDADVQAYIRAVQPGAKHVMSVCNGAFILAQTGLLDGKQATTFYGLIETFAQTFPTIRAVDDQRFVDNGQIVTTAGVSSGIDGALHVLEEDLGAAMARTVALNIEYDWRPDSGFARAKLADMPINHLIHAAMALKPLPPEALRVVETAGDERRWTVAFEVTGQGDAKALTPWLEAGTAQRGWTRTPEGLWSFKDDKGRAWKGRTAVKDAAVGARIEVHVEIAG